MFSSSGFNFSKQDIISVVVATGEFVGRFVKEDEEAIVLLQPMAFMIDEERRPFFAPSVCASGSQSLTEVRFMKGNIITAVPSHEEIAQAWISKTSGIVA